MRVTSTVSGNLFSLFLIDSDTNQEVFDFSKLPPEGLEISSQNFNIAATLNSDNPDSIKIDGVRFQTSLGDRNITGEQLTYLAFETGQPITEGSFIVSVTGYDAAENGELYGALGAVDLSFTIEPIAPEPEPPMTGSYIAGIELIDSETDTSVPGYEQLAATNQIDINLVARYNIVIDLVPATEAEVKSCRFQSTSQAIDRTENPKPYSLFGDNNNSSNFNFYARDSVIGDNDLTITLYSETNGGGTELETVTLSYEFVDGSTPEPNPDPVDGSITPDPAPVTEARLYDDQPKDLNLPFDKQTEQDFVLSLVSIPALTHTFTSNGLWSDPSNWNTGVVPNEGARVRIPYGLFCTFDLANSPNIFTLRIDGNLSFITTANTRLNVDTLVVTNSGKLSIGTATNSIIAGAIAEIVFTEDGRALNDENHLSLGLISLGTVNMRGATKTPHAKPSIVPMAGDTVLNFSAAPMGWQVGDRLVIPGTQLTSYSSRQDEERTITAINGTAITIDQPLAHNHQMPRGYRCHVANLTRNIRLSSAVPGTISKRGHTIFMHRNDVDLRNVAFIDLGRTDKSTTVGGDSNPNGRYSCHFHRQEIALSNNPSIASGCVVERSPGWGFAHHSSFSAYCTNISYDVEGGHFVAESGDETGRWVNNLAISGRGSGGSSPKQITNTSNAANNGTGYFFQGRLVENANNWAYGLSYGFTYFHRNTTASVDGVLPSTLESQFATRYKTPNSTSFISIDNPPIQAFNNCGAVATTTGLIVIKNSSNQRHSNRTMIDNFVALNVLQGVELDYTGHYTLTDLECVAAPGTKNGSDNRSRAVQLGQNIFDISIINLYAESFLEAINIGRIADKPEFNDIPNNVIIVDLVAIDCDISVDDNGHTNGHVTRLSASDLHDRIATLELNSSSDLTIDNYGGQSYVRFRGTMRDQLGDCVYMINSEHAEMRHSHSADFVNLVNRGIYTLPNGAKCALHQECVTDRLTGEWFVHDIPLLLGSTVLADSRTNAPDLGALAATQINGVWTTNSAPTAQFKRVTLATGQTIEFSVFDHVRDGDGDSFQLIGFQLTEKGTLELVDALTGTFRYTSEEMGYEHFTYRVSGSGRETEGKVQLSVAA